MNGFKFGILFAIASIFHIQTAQSQGLGRQKCDTVDILFMIDYSRSFHGNEAKLVNAISAYVDSLAVDSQAIKIGFIWFDCSSHPLNITGNRKDIEDELKYVKTLQASKGTLFAKAFTDAWLLFYYSSIAREKCCAQSGVQKCIILISDGKVIDHDDYLAAVKEADGLKKTGIVIGAIGVGDMNDKSREHLETLSTDGCFIKTDFDHLKNHLFELRLCSH